MNDRWFVLRSVARQLGSVAAESVFTGGAVVPLYLDATYGAGVRVTLDVDVVVDTPSRTDYYRIEAYLRERGWVQSLVEAGPICRWLTPDGVRVDVMPIDGAVLGFTNAWYAEGVSGALQFDVGDEQHVRVFDAATFVATKIAAFDGRGDNDWYGSHDLEDVITLIEGRSALVHEVAQAPPRVRAFVGLWSRRLLSQPSPHDIVEGHVSREGLRSGVLGAVLARVVALSELVE